ncbi:MAG: haloacid dehalogenase-like hydrolase [Lyngbya sp.]|nr:haloacid dehalogenase-like hydrolase [Lyngbya sp.]
MSLVQPELQPEVSPFKRSPSEVEDCLKTSGEDGLILLDLDETLFLRNSTEEYLNTLKPGILGAILLILLDVLKPWNFLPGNLKGEVSRDWLRVIISTLIFPWTMLLWQGKAKKLAELYSNSQLVKMLAEKPKSAIVIATLGFNPIVDPLIKHLPLEVSRTVACRFWRGGADRIKGKYQLVADQLGEEKVAQAIAITDSPNDNPLLAAVAQPYLVTWPGAEYVPALSDTYIPFFYLERIKRPGEKYFLRVILADDWLVLILATSWISPVPVLHAGMVLFFLLSFWCIYEVGYLENDRVAEQFEKSPTLSNTYSIYKREMKWQQPWIWAAILAIPGLFLLNSIQSQFFLEYFTDTMTIQVISVTLWIALLVLVRISFWVYNYIDKQTRTWLYLILQAYKTFGFLLLTPTNVVGTLLFSAQVLSRWICYLTYRYAHKDWLNLPGELLRCLIFSFLLMAIAVGTRDVHVFWNGQAFVIFIWCLYRGRLQLLSILNQAHCIDQDRWEVKA